MIPNLNLKMLYVDTAFEWLTLGWFLCMGALFATVFAMVCLALAVSWAVTSILTGDLKKLYDVKDA